MNKDKIITDIIAIVCDMLQNNAEIATDGMAESFYDWCEGGDIFYNGYENYTKEEREYACDIMLRITKNVNNLSQQLYELYEKGE